MRILGLRPRLSGSGAAFWTKSECTGTITSTTAKKGDIGASLTGFRNTLFLWIGPASPRPVDQVVCCKWSSGDATEAYCIQIEMIGVARQVCSQFNVPFVVVDKSSALKEVAGAARAPKSVSENDRSKWISKQLRAGCLSRGFPVKNDTIAEAFAAVELFRSRLHPDCPSSSAGPLFAGAAA